jgi:hypothetical protein
MDASADWAVNAGLDAVGDGISATGWLCLQHIPQGLCPRMSHASKRQDFGEGRDLGCWTQHLRRTGKMSP